MTSSSIIPATLTTPRGGPTQGRPTRPAQGMALLVVLMFLLVTTGITLYSARSAITGESASRNQMSNELAKQAAEAALRDAERDLFLTANVATACQRNDFGLDRFTSQHFTANCFLGQCQPLPPTTAREWITPPDPAKAEPWWPASRGGLWNDNKTALQVSSCNFAGGVPLGTFTKAPPLVGVALQPEYLIELMQRGDTRYFRITARGFGLTTDTQVVLQSYLEFPS